MTLDENDLRAGMRALAGGVPPAPPERAEASVRRSVRIRRTRAAASVALVVALAAPAVLVARMPSRDAAPTASGPASPVHAWPDRADASLAAVRDSAVRDYADNHGGPSGGETVRHLYSGYVDGTRSVAVAFAYCGPQACSRAVLTSGEVDASLNAFWMPVTRAVRGGEPESPLSTLLDETDRSDSREASRNVLLVVGPPEARVVRWSSEERVPGTGGARTLRSSTGVFAGGIGYLSAPVTVRVVGGGGDADGVGTAGNLDDRTGVGTARYIDVPDVPDGWEQEFGYGSQVGTAEHPGWNAPFPGGPYAVFVRCVGVGTLRVTGKGVDGQLPCDGRTLRLESRGEVPAGGLGIRMSGDPFTAYAFAVATPARSG